MHNSTRSLLPEILIKQNTKFDSFLHFSKWMSLWIDLVDNLISVLNSDIGISLKYSYSLLNGKCNNIFFHESGSLKAIILEDKVQFHFKMHLIQLIIYRANLKLK